jgi:nicotinate-nucleotide adenylyltransferase
MVGLFGGSFDPIHHGHLIVGRAVAETLALDELRFMPAGEQPFKRGRHVATARERAEMVALAVAGESGLAVERCEVDRPGPSYTVDTLRELRRREPGQDFTLVVGADASRELNQWREAEALPALARIVAVARPGAPRPDSTLVERVVEVPAVDLSATEIRRRVAGGRSIRYLVPDAVAEFIATHGLYRDGDG